jgi:ABC-2 type transport system ATP-binding protein
MTEASLVVDGLSARIGSFHLDGVSFTVQPGQVTALLGHNGAGKTTTFRLIMGLVRKDGGRVSFGGLDHVRDEIEFKRHVGFVQEESFFYGAMTVSELAAFVSPFYDNWNKELAEGLIAQFGLPTNKKVAEFSKGMRTKTGIVLALSHEPRILLLDEPTSGLDPRARVEILAWLRRVARERGKAVLFSTHNLHEVERVADRILIVDRGRLLADDDLAGLRERGGTGWTLERTYLELVP